MRLLGMLFLTIFNHLASAQNFEASSQYAVTATRSLITSEILDLELEERPSINCYVYDVHSPLKPIIMIEPAEHELFDSVQVAVLKNPGLRNVKEILRIEIEYSACCFWGDISYYIVMNSGEMKKLPDLHQAYCDWPADIDEYYFPVQHDKGKTIIQHNTVSINNEGDIDKIKTNELLLWNGKQFSVLE